MGIERNAKVKINRDKREEKKLMMFENKSKKVFDFADSEMDVSSKLLLQQVNT